MTAAPADRVRGRLADKVCRRLADEIVLGYFEPGARLIKPGPGDQLTLKGRS